jgi:hypothetical protein
VTNTLENFYNEVVVARIRFYPRSEEHREMSVSTICLRLKHNEGVSVFFALAIRHENHKFPAQRYSFICGRSVCLYYIFPHYIINGDRGVDGRIILKWTLKK